MSVSFRSLVNLPVYTKMNTYLGRVVDVECDEAQFQLTNILVQPRGISNMFKKPLVINRTQIVEMTKTKVVVDDTTVEEGVGAEVA